MEVTEAEKLQITSETIGPFPIWKDKYDEKFLILSLEEQYYLDDENYIFLEKVAEYKEAINLDGRQYATLFCLGYSC